MLRRFVVSNSWLFCDGVKRGYPAFMSVSTVVVVSTLPHVGVARRNMSPAV